MGDRPRLGVRDLTVSYGAHEVVHQISFNVGAGSSLALLGANGSGKSTTVKALTGLNKAGPGFEITFNGVRVAARDLTPSGTRRLGIRVVHQESPLIGDLAVADMMALHIGFPVTGGIVRRRELMRIAASTLAEFDVAVDPTRLCRDLNAGDRALVSLAISMAGIAAESALLILDEATASLTSKDAHRLLRRVRDATQRGLSVLMVTHRLSEVAEYCDRTLVMRDGDVVASFTHEDFSEDEAIAHMVGTKQDEADDQPHHVPATVSSLPAGAELRVRHLSGRELREATFSSRPGEILGVTGRNGEGASELLRLVAGVARPVTGTVEIAGVELEPGSPRSAILQGVHYLSSDRFNEGGVPLMTVGENMLLPRVERYGLRRRGAAADIQRYIKKLAVHPADPQVHFGSLSGGNQQKVLLARWLLVSPRVMLLDDPTAGVDPKTREVIFQQLKALAGEGTCIVLRSSELEHLARLCDRVLVVQDGRIVDQLEGADLTIEGVTHATFA